MSAQTKRIRIQFFFACDRQSWISYNYNKMMTLLSKGYLTLPIVAYCMQIKWGSTSLSLSTPTKSSLHPLGAIGHLWYTHIHTHIHTHTHPHTPEKEEEQWKLNGKKKKRNVENETRSLPFESVEWNLLC